MKSLSTETYKVVADSNTIILRSDLNHLNDAHFINKKEIMEESPISTCDPTKTIEMIRILNKLCKIINPSMSCTNHPKLDSFCFWNCAWCSPWRSLGGVAFY